MASKTDLERQIRELQKRVDELETRLLIAETNKGITVVYPKAPAPIYPWNPYWPPKITCSTTAVSKGIVGTTSYN